jgi:hypothetical protein
VHDADPAARLQRAPRLREKTERLFAMEEVEEQHDVGSIIRKAGAVAHHIAQHRRYIGEPCRLRFGVQLVEQRLFDIDGDNLAACAARNGQSEGAVTGADIDDRTLRPVEAQAFQDARADRKTSPNNLRRACRSLWPSWRAQIIKTELRGPNCATDAAALACNVGSLAYRFFRSVETSKGYAHAAQPPA